MSVLPSAFVVRLLGAFAALVWLAAGTAQAGVTLTHVHGLAWSGDGARLYVPSHHGLAIYEAGRWAKAPGPEHDYMGFTATRERFYSSGHPAPRSGLANPFGLIRSDDGGKTWTKLGLEGEADFHLLAAGFETHAVYVFNAVPNSRMKLVGIYHTRNDGFAWKPAAGVGLTGEPASLAVHPTDPAVVAMGTGDGLFVSDDAAERFRRVADGQTLAVFFDLDARHLWYSGYDGTASLHRLDRSSGAAVEVALPPLAGDAVAYIAQNPASRNEYAVATFKRNVFVSRDGGATWVAIARDGRGLEH